MTQVSVQLVSISKVDIRTHGTPGKTTNVSAKTGRGLPKALAVENVTARRRYPPHRAVCLLMGGKHREVLACGSWPDSKVNVFLTCYVTKTLSTFQTAVHQINDYSAGTSLEVRILGKQTLLFTVAHLVLLSVGHKVPGQSFFNTYSWNAAGMCTYQEASG